MGQNDGGETAWSYGKRSDVYYQSVPCNGEENKPKHPKLTDVYCYCSNVGCGQTFVMNVSFSYMISPSALSGQGRIKELIHALPPDERQKALELLLAAKESQ